ncbi:MAG: replication initiation protein [Tateyamaria sp.]|uniref:replication initiation protein n=1 Tax=Tateyamaria sp. TaxID=1929288 RepID=UPI00329B9970
MKLLDPSSLQSADAVAAGTVSLLCPARLDQASIKACSCRGIHKKLCELERGIINWKDLSYLQLLELRQKQPSHPDLPNHDAKRAFEEYWMAKSWEETKDTKGWKQIYLNRLPPRDTLLREDRLPLFGQYGAVDEQNTITERIRTERFVMMLMEYIQTDRYGLFDVLSIDVDCDFDLRLLEQAGLPLPRYFVSRRRQAGDAPTFVRRPHLVFWLRFPVQRYRNNRQTREAQYIEAIRETLIQRLTNLGLKVDPKRPDLSKNPHHDAWDVVQGDYRDWSLRELHQALGTLESPKAPWQIEKSNPAPTTPLVDHLGDGTAGTSHDEILLEGYEGRNTFIFDKTRSYGYGLKRQKLDDAEIARRIDQFAHDLNEVRFATHSEGPLKPSEVDDTVRSVTNFVINRYQPGEDSKNRGACIREGLIEARMTKKTRQGVGGKYAAGKSADKTRQRVHDAIDALGGWHHQINISALAEEAGVSRPTARKWRNIIATEMTASSAPEMENTVHIRKGDVITTPAVEQVEVLGSTGLVLEGLDLRLAQTSIRVIKSTPAANIPYKPIPVRRGSGKQVLYRHPFNNSFVLTEGGDVLGAHITKIETQQLKKAPIHILDRAGFLDDSPDEYAPPIGETDHSGRVRYDEGYHAPSRVDLETWEWSDDEVDRYFGDLKLA